MSAKQEVILSGIRPTGRLHFGNYFGAIKQFIELQETDNRCYYFIADYHALTTITERRDIYRQTLDMLRTYVACGLDPEKSIIYRQSDLPATAELALLFGMITNIGYLERGTTYKDKIGKLTTDEGDTEGNPLSYGLLGYPVLMAADILIVKADKVPVGDDQRQHLELTRDLALRFNHRYGDTFVVPEATFPPAGARVMDLQAPTRKMSKSEASPQGTILVLEDLAKVAKKVKRAVTDTETEVRYDREAKPGVSNLLDILSACTGEAPEALAGRYQQYGPLKADTAEAVVELLRPIQERYRALAEDPAGTAELLAVGARKAAEVAEATLGRARDALGLLPR